MSVETIMLVVVLSLCGGAVGGAVWPWVARRLRGPVPSCGPVSDWYVTPTKVTFDLPVEFRGPVTHDFKPGITSVATSPAQSGPPQNA